MGMKELAEQIVKWRPTLNKKGKPLNDLGQEMPDPMPLEPPVGFSPGEDLTTKVRRMVQSERLAAMAEAAGDETFDEADDFDVPDDPVDPSTPWEADFDRAQVRDLVRRRQAEYALEQDWEMATRANRKPKEGSIPDAGAKPRSKAKKPPADAGDVLDDRPAPEEDA